VPPETGFPPDLDFCHFSFARAPFLLLNSEEMSDTNENQEVLTLVKGYRDQMASSRERILADAVMIGEIPALTFGEERLVRFLCDRFTEEGLDQISVDEVQNATAMLPGKVGKQNILIAAHTDRIWDPSIDHTISVSSDSLTGPGIADNALGVAALTILPFLLKSLNIGFNSNLVLLGASRSMGRGDLQGLRFFADNVSMPIGAGICVEGVQLGRLSYSSLGMNRCEIKVNTHVEHHWESWSLSGAIISLNRIVQRILSIETPEVPKTSIILGSVNSGSSFNVPPTRATLRFEVRSEEPGMVARIREQIEEAIEQEVAENRINASLEVIARRKPGSIGFNHPFVRCARGIMKELGITPQVAPSTSELSVLLEKGIPSLTLGITEGDNKHQLDETVKIKPIFSGLAQLIGVIQSIDKLLENE
jgi:acetylornithine deacetylase/succinyl-diaminopimelate desuccinylase-like protein